jgi:NAD(P)-dependent dehydrogenase (short-subunit alcohol dehydrogenase family)
MDRLRGKRVLITGGSSGIGIACAQLLSERGARVFLLARGGEGLAKAARTAPGVAGWAYADVADVEQLRPAIAEATAVLGGLDVVVAAAGAAVYGPFLQAAPEDYGRTLATTLVGVLNTSHVTLPELERTGGVLVVVGSIAGRVPAPWLASYAAAKHGVRGFVRSLSCELRARRSSARVALIAPGPVDTPFWRRAHTTDRRLPPRLRGAYRPEEVAEEVLNAICSPGRTERTVGGLMATWAVLDGLAPNLVVRAMGPAARLGWRARESRPISDQDGLHGVNHDTELSGGLTSRPSVLTKLRRTTAADARR